MKLKELIQHLESIAPKALQESYDNSGLLVGNPEDEVKKALIALDATEVIIDEAIKNKCDLIITHHPIIFKGIKSLTGKNYVERVLLKAIKNNIALYCAHTNLDNVSQGVNGMLCKVLGLNPIGVLIPKEELLFKLVTFVPKDHLFKVQQAIFEAGAGHIGKYDSCSFSTEGNGTFKAGEGAKPFVGKLNQFHTEPEYRLETVFPSFLKSKVLTALKSSHPYEEVAFDLYALENTHSQIGSGLLAETKKPMSEEAFLKRIKSVLGLKQVKFSPKTGKTIQKVALCGGSGAFLIEDAKRCNADVYVTGDLKYHDYFEADGNILLVDAGHYETEQFTCQLFFDLIREKFPKFAVQISVTGTNPINYL